jgi:hypothetical protein
MPNPVLVAKLEERAQQVATVDAILEQVEGRDLVDAEKSLLESAQERIAALDAQIKPLEQFEALRGAHAESLGLLGQGGRDRLPAQPRRADGGERTPEYRTPGEYLVDTIRARGLMGGDADQAAQARIAAAQTRVVADQKTSNTPGILPQPIVGQIISLLDSRRPLVTSLGGAKGMGGIPGTQFTRPKVTQHTAVGLQAGEKTQLASQNMVISSITFAKKTYGGTVDISRQDMDWTQPSAWDILVRDLANVYSVQVETAVAADFAASATGTKPPALPATPTLSDWSKALYTAGMHSYTAGQQMPDRIWCGLDVWAALGSLVDTQRVVLPVDTTREMGAPGTSSLESFAGDLFGLPRIVCPLFPAKTCIVGPSSLYEVYEEMVGLLSVIEPTILGVQVAYGGYVAFSNLAPSAFIALDLSAVTGIPTMETFDPSAPAPEETAAPAHTGRKGA